LPQNCNEELGQRRIQGGDIGAKPPPGPVKSINFWGVHAPTGAEPPPGKKKI